MTKLQKRALEKILADNENISITGARYEENAEGQLVRTEINSTEETNRLFASEDFKRGWAECYQRFADLLTFVLNAPPADLKKYAGSGKRGKKGK